MTRGKEDQRELFSALPRIGSAPKPLGQHRGANALNDLGTKEWLLATKSVWYRKAHDLQIPYLEETARALVGAYGAERTEQLLGQLTDSVMLSRPPARDEQKRIHPATFAEADIERLILFFSKEGETVLDPFLGSGSTLVACRNTRRSGLGIEVVREWAEVARKRCYAQPELFESEAIRLNVIEDDARVALQRLAPDSVSFVVTSPPYWSMLNKRPDHKVKKERVQRNLPTRYSRQTTDLANTATYEGFLSELQKVFRECYRVLKSGRYMAVIVSDFRDGNRFYLFHSDVAKVLEDVGFHLAGLTVLVQDSKALYPYGMPYAFVSNIHHQFVVIGRKQGGPSKGKKSRQRKNLRDKTGRA